MVKVGDIEKFLTGWAPLETAQDWDNCGLLCGNPEQEVSRVLVALDVTEEVVEEGLKKQAQLIISHHPVIFSPLKKINENSQQGRLLRTLIRNEISVLSLHTNLDIAKDGVNEILAARLHLGPCEILAEEYTRAFQKVCVFVPVEFMPRVREAMFEAGGGQYGHYSGCSFHTAGEGTFLPGKKANPFIGSSGQTQTVKELKLEMVVPKDLTGRVVAAMLSAHPYETPAFDVFDTFGLSEPLGIGRIGDLKRPMAFEEFLPFVKDALGCRGLRYAGKRDWVRRVAVGGGACISYMDQAFLKGADVFITSDVKYHEMLDGAQKGYFLIDAGHFPTEDGICDYLVQKVGIAFPDISIGKSEVHRDVTRFFV
jgi:dinuclear metal center YbgI/SA1388 family protein